MALVTSVYSVTVCVTPFMSMYVTASFAHAVMAVSIHRSSAMAARLIAPPCSQALGANESFMVIVFFIYLKFMIIFHSFLSFIGAQVSKFGVLATFL
jgi:hypothetical protein